MAAQSPDFVHMRCDRGRDRPVSETITSDIYTITLPRISAPTFPPPEPGRGAEWKDDAWR